MENGLIYQVKKQEELKVPLQKRKKNAKHIQKPAKKQSRMPANFQADPSKNKTAIKITLETFSFLQLERQEVTFSQEHSKNMI